MAVRSGVLVAMLTGAALTTVVTLGLRAHQEAPPAPRSPGPASPAATGAAAAPERPGSRGLPARSGAGERVVYSLGRDRVWLVDARGGVRRAFRVVPGAVDPAPGRYAVTSRSLRGVGADGTPIEHVVRFADVRGVVVGFSAPRDGAPAAGGPAPGTGGIRASGPDGLAMWDFAVLGTRVVVVG
ncbi:hypothetical protein [Streptomyces sp. MJP52]|uniref:hypothetical protein n=1 Tax=Streptomyces sp. MJP52 TaxID=2940555 RepID=UPI0024737497|nr:hypothetical protein [Streptomyces sp. MJP52]MDH6225505.1 hypothetical protein [Streptomyces sp. MJP52]